MEIRNPENVPIKGPAILAINHPNNLLDTLIVAGSFKLRIHFLATGALFKNFLVATFLKNAGLIPIYRPEDSSNHQDKNKKTFHECYSALEHEKILGIYPEGTTHADWQVKKIKTGTARILLEAEKQNNFQLGVQLIPIGLNFSSRKKFRTSVTVSVGKPVPTEPHFDKHKKGEFSAVENLTQDLQKAIEKEVKHLEQSTLQEFIGKLEFFYQEEMISILHQEKQILKSEIDKFRLSKKLIDGVEFYAQRQPEVITYIWDKIENYHKKLKRARLNDKQIRREVDKNIKPIRYLRIGFTGLLGLPLFLYGLLNNYVANFFPARLSRRLAGKETDVATIRVVSGIISFSLFYSLQTFLVFYYFGPLIALIYFISLPFSGFFVLIYRKFYRRYFENVRFGFLISKHQKYVDRLKSERLGISEELNRLSEQFLFMEKKQKESVKIMPI